MSQKITPGRLRTMMCVMDTCTLHRTRITVPLREPYPLSLSRHMEGPQVWHDLIVLQNAFNNVIFSPYYITCTGNILRSSIFSFGNIIKFLDQTKYCINKNFLRKKMLTVNFKILFVCVCV